MILSILGSSAIGTIIGGVFAYLNKKQDINLEIAKLQHALQLRDKDIELSKIEAQANVQISMEGTEQARFLAIQHTADQDSDYSKAPSYVQFLLVIADFLRKLIRPLSTALLLSGALYCCYMTVTLVKDPSPAMLDQALGWIFGQSAAIISYWFVSRGRPS